MTEQPFPQDPAAPPTGPTIPAGWLADPGNPTLLRYWDGSAWTENTAPARVAAPQQSGPYQSVSVGSVKTSHTFHLIATLCTCGLWGLFVWLPMIFINKMRKDKVVTTYR